MRTFSSIIVVVFSLTLVIEAKAITLVNAQTQAKALARAATKNQATSQIRETSQPEVESSVKMSPQIPNDPSVEADATDDEDAPWRLSDEVIPFGRSSAPNRPEPILELGGDFLGTGHTGEGYELPTGAVWRPQLLVFGTFRSAIQGSRQSGEARSEWANRLDLFANLQLTGTERFLVGVRPLDRNGNFTSYQFQPDESEGWEESYNGNIQTLFFEGDIGELFPRMDPNAKRQLDYGIAVGRQQLRYQNGLLLDDTIDAIGISRNSIKATSLSNLQISSIFGWNEVNRGDNVEDSSALLYGLTAEADAYRSSFNAELFFIDSDFSDGDGIFGGLSSTQRFGHINTTFRALFSSALDGENERVGNGGLLFSELSFTPTSTDDIVYFNSFLGLNNYSSAARAEPSGGAVSATGIAFESVNLGRFERALNDSAREAGGFALGYQLFSKSKRQQVILELGGRQQIRGTSNGALALAARYQIAFGQHLVVIIDSFGALNEARDNSFGGRLEFLIKM